MKLKNKRLKRFSLVNLIAGYVMVFMFILLVISNRASESMAEEIVDRDAEVVYADDLFNGVHEDELETETLYVDGHPLRHTRIIRDNSVGVDRSRGVILGNDTDVTVFRDDVIDNIAVVSGAHDRGNDIYIDNDRDVGIIRGNNYDRIHDRTNGSGRHHGNDLVGSDISSNKHNRSLDHDVGEVDFAALDRAVLERRLDEAEAKEAEEFAIDNNDDLSGLTLARDNDNDFELDIDDLEDNNKGAGLGKGDLYAYNFPSQGVGAGIGSGAVGAGAGGGAGIGAGVGEAVLNGKAVPTLGGVGTSPLMPANLKATPENDRDGDGLPASIEAQIGTNPNSADTDGDGVNDGEEFANYSNPLNKESTPANPGSSAPPQVGGVGGLTSGAGAGGAAGLVTGMVTEKLGLGIGGCAEHGGSCEGHHGHGRDYSYEHLPKDGALHIMMHVDGSGSILDTRKQLDIMRDTLLKEALLPYYNNDKSLYDRRVQIVDGNGERTLQFFTDAAKKENVLAVVFQDEAQPSYHLPTFNKRPQDHYSKDLGKLKESLNGYGGVYRGVMFQVDRGRTFAKSFKEFVECSWRGEGYLEKDNLKKYYWEHNHHHIKNKDGVVFSDVYHAKDSGDPQYYLDLIFQASEKVGLDLNIYGAGLKDGKYNNKVD
jgi:hypothetical protein